MGRLLLYAGWTFAAPGAGQGVAGRKLRFLAWAAAGLASLVALTWSVWALPVALAVRLASALDAVWLLRARDAAQDDRKLPIYATVVGVVAVIYFELAIESYRIPASSMMPAIAVGDTVYVDRLTTHVSPIRRGEVITFGHPCHPTTTYIKRVVGLPGDTVEIRCGQLYVNARAVPTTLVAAATTYTDVADAGAVERSASRYRETLDGHTYDTYLRAEHGADAETTDFPQLDGLQRSCANQRDLRINAPGKQPVGELVETMPGAAACEPQLHLVVPADSLFTLGDNRGNSNDSRQWGVVPFDNITGRAIGVVWPIGHLGAMP